MSPVLVLVSVARDLYVGAGIRLGTVGLSVGTKVLGDGGAVLIMLAWGAILVGMGLSRDEPLHSAEWFLLIYF